MPIVANLIRVGLVVDEALGTWDFEPSWSVTPYGFRFLRYVSRRLLPELEAATVVGVHGSRSGFLIKNLGPGTALVTQLRVTTDGSPLLSDPALPITLDPGTSFDIPANDTVPPNGGARIELTWMDELMRVRTSERIQWRT